MNKIILLLIALCIGSTVFAQTKSIPEQLAQEQLEAYNNRKIDAFLLPYSDSVEVYAFPNKLLYKGKSIMRQEYEDMFTNTKDLHCTLVKRIVLGNKVIDEESVVFDKTKPAFRAVAIYIIEADKIAKVYFMQ